MKQNPDFILGNVAGSHILMPVGRAAIDLDGMITLNDVGVFIWEKLSEEITYPSLLQCIVSRFDVTEETADADLRAFLDVLKEAKAIIE